MTLISEATIRGPLSDFHYQVSYLHCSAHSIRLYSLVFGLHLQSRDKRYGFRSDRFIPFFP
jgi:hypothetical protein